MSTSELFVPVASAASARMLGSGIAEFVRGEDLADQLKERTQLTMTMIETR